MGLMEAGIKGMDRRLFMQASAGLGIGMGMQRPAEELVERTGAEDRKDWVALACRTAEPVLLALKQRRLKQSMPVETLDKANSSRREYTHLEALGRLLTGLAPWLEVEPEEEAERRQWKKIGDLARAAIDAGTDPHSADWMNFKQGGQPVVDAAFLSLAILRAPHALWAGLEERVQRNVIRALESTRDILPGYSNWLLFSATVEAALCKAGVWWDRMRVDYALRTVNSWYRGDSMYSDGPIFHFDYYNGIVIHPMLLGITDAVAEHEPEWRALQAQFVARARRHAEIQERLIGPEGSYPLVGRSLCYRFGVFHLLADVSLRGLLPEGIAPAQVRCALSTVMRRVATAAGTFDAQGWLQLGVAGHQPQLAEGYISTGSCYLCSAAWLPLGLPVTNAFWTGGEQPWSARAGWSGGALKADHAMAEGELNVHSRRG